MSISEKADLLSEALRDVEDALASLNLGTSAEVPLGPYTLKWGKNGAVWCLMAVHDDGQRHPLLTASLAVRVDACNALGPLFEDLIHKAAERESDIDKAINNARNFAHRVRTTPCAGEEQPK